MRAFVIFLLAATAIVALPSPPPGLTPRSRTTPANTLTLTQPHNTTSSLADIWPTICYYNIIIIRAVNQLSCAPLIAHLANRPDFATPKVWLPGAVEPVWTVQGCRVRIVSGQWEAMFSLRNAMVEMEKVLTLCQPPGYRGIGGSTPVAGQEGIMWGSFHVEVTGVL